GARTVALLQLSKLLLGSVFRVGVGEGGTEFLKECVIRGEGLKTLALKPGVGTPTEVGGSIDDLALVFREAGRIRDKDEVQLGREVTELLKFPTESLRVFDLVGNFRSCRNGLDQCWSWNWDWGRRWWDRDG